MPKNIETKRSEAYFKQSFIPTPGLRSYFGMVQKGQSQVYDTPFARGESTEELLKSWNEVLVSIRTKWPTLYDFEVDLAKKVGPMSVMQPLSARMQDIESYYEGILLPSKPISTSAIAAVSREWSRLRGLRLRSQKRTNDGMKLSTNSGSPYFTKRRIVQERTIPNTVYPLKNQVIQHLPENHTSHQEFKAAAVLGWRGQEGGISKDDTKQRVVWMFPYAVNVSELQVYQPLIESAQKFEIVPAWVSMDLVDKRITDLFDTKSSNDLVVCTDFTKFDQHFNADLQYAAKTILASILTREASSISWLQQVFPIKYMIPLAYDWDRVKFGFHGMGSGSGGTNADETLAHRALQYEAAILAGEKLNPNSQCLGDDGILSYPGITVEDVVRAYSAHGLEVNEAKQYASTQDCTYLRRWHHKDYRVDGICAGVYSTNRALGRLRYLERYMDPEYWDAKAVALRQLSILENVKYHPLKEEFVQFCMKRDKYRLGLDIPHFFDDIERIVDEKIENMPDFLGYVQTLQNEGKPHAGIAEWWIVKYLRSQK